MQVNVWENICRSVAIETTTNDRFSIVSLYVVYLRTKHARTQNRRALHIYIDIIPLAACARPVSMFCDYTLMFV